jgi:hypothetical protein
MASAGSRTLLKAAGFGPNQPGPPIEPRCRAAARVRPGRLVPIVDFRTRDSSRSIDARPMAAGAGARAGPHHWLIICQQADATVSPGRPKHSPSLARECEEASRKRPEPFGKARRFSGTTQPAHWRSGGRECQRRVNADPESKVACACFRPAQQPEQKAADGCRTQGNAFCNGCQREQDDGKTPKRLLVFPVHRMPVHHRCPPTFGGDYVTRHMSMSRTIFCNQKIP